MLNSGRAGHAVGDVSKSDAELRVRPARSSSCLGVGGVGWAGVGWRTDS